MVADLAIYTVVHQPRRLKLPAQPIPRGASIPEIYHCIFDERMNERYFRKVAQYCYYPAARMFLDRCDNDAPDPGLRSLSRIRALLRPRAQHH